MQRAGIGRDHEFRTAHQRHQRSEFERDRNGRRVPCCREHFLRQIFFSWAEADDAAPAVLFGELAMQFAVALAEANTSSASLRRDSTRKSR